MDAQLVSLTALLILSLASSGAAQIKCYTCTYVYSGNDGSYNRECVTSPANHTLTSKVDCPEGQLCTVKATYDPGFARLLSLSRNCLARDTEPDGCVDNVLRPSCVERCAENLCNDKDGDIHRRLTSTDGKNSGTSSYLSSTVAIAASVIGVARWWLSM